MRTVVPRARRFWAKVDMGDGCWEWTGQRNHNGYGLLTSGPRVAMRRELAHRVSWETSVGPIPEGLQVLHRCDNPPCVNPAHLFLGTQTDNLRDMTAKGRGYNPFAKLTPTQVAAIRASTNSAHQLAAAFGVSAHSVRRIRRRGSWKAVA